MASVIAAVQSGMVLGSEFEVVRLLRHGGMGSVYEARQRTTGATRALKVMRASLSSDSKFRARFEQEARVGARIASDHVVQVISAGVDENARVPWIAMELLEGEDLGEWIERHGAMALGEARLVIDQLCHALAAAHAVGVVHRDLKPENVFLSRSRIVGVPFLVKVLDFGVAKIVSEAKSATVAVGTPYFMAPEQTHPSPELGAPCDVWALGLLVYRLLTGKHFWLTANSEEDSGLARLWREILIDPIPPASERAAAFGVKDRLPPSFDQWFARCLAREPSERFTDAAVAHASFVASIESLALTQPGAVGSASSLSIQGTLGEATPGRLSSISRTRPRVTFREGAERILIDAERGARLLDVSLGANVPHYHACGGRARCTTCRVVVLEGVANLSPRSDAEQKIATARRWPDAIRLACQAHVHGDITVRRLVVDPGDAAAVSAGHTTQEPHADELLVGVISFPGLDGFAREQFPHDVVHIFNRYLQHAIAPVISNRGRVLRNLPLGALVAFGAPEDSPERVALDAVRAALRIVVRVRQLNPYTLRHFGQELDVAVALARGTVLHADVGHASHAERIAFGDPIYRASNAAIDMAHAGVRVAVDYEVAKTLGQAVQQGQLFGAAAQPMVEILDFATPDVVYLVQGSFESVTPRASEFAQAFYERLFEIYPESARLFEKTDMTAQRGMLMDVLQHAISSLQDFDKLVPTIQDLGRRHVGYGVTPQHYKYVGRALMETLERFLGPEFTPEVHVAWLEIYGTLARTMIEASQS
jgi:serine/threonine protein kinase/hemoglobin-like flavoprotein/class 3 adenylate cyclase